MRNSLNPCYICIYVWYIGFLLHLLAQASGVCGLSLVSPDGLVHMCCDLAQAALRDAVSNSPGQPADGAC